ncbi:MAG: insulinase family protein, partial [Waddliaceae bacterium]
VSVSLVDDYNEVPIVITLRGCDPENVEGLEKVLRSTLEDIIQKGIPENLVENAIHQVEFHRSEISGDSYPYGLSLFLRSGLLKQHGGNPEDALLIHSLCDGLRERAKENPDYFLSLIRKHLLDNSHFVSVVAKPDKDLALKEQQEEKELLDKISRDFDDKKKKEIANKAKELVLFQEEQEHADLDGLPKVTLSDVPKHSRNYPLAIEEVGNLKVFHHDCFTNDIVYSTLVFPLPAIEEKELPLLKLLSLVMPQMGCGGRSYTENLDYIQAHTGGVGAAETINVQASDFDVFHPYFYLQGKALYRKVDKLFPLLQEMTTSTDLTDIPRLKEVLLKHFTGLQAALNQNALRYAISLSTSGLSMASRIGNAWGGLEYYYFIKDLAENFDERRNDLINQLQAMQNRVLCLRDPHLVITCDDKMYSKLKGEHFYGLKNIPAKSYEPWKSDYSLPKIPLQGRVIASPVAFTSKTFKTLPYTHKDTPALNAAAHLFDNLTLHPRIREQGGAYGGGAMNNSLAGNFCFYAYRDPNLSSTFAAFDEAVEKILGNDFKDSDLEEAKLEIYQGLDSPIAPGSRGQVSYSWLREGKTLEVRQTFRDSLFQLRRKDVVEAVKTHIYPKYDSGCTVAFAGKELLEKENDILISQGKNPLQIEKI